MKNLIIIFLYINISIFTSCKNKVTGSEYLLAIQADSNLTKCFENENFTIKVKYIPTDYILIKELQNYSKVDKNKINKEFEKYNKSSYFKVSIVLKNLSNLTSNNKKSLLNFWGQDVANKFYLSNNDGKTFSASLFESTPLYDGDSSIDLILGFNIKQENLMPCKLQLNSPLLSTQSISEISFEKETLNNIPNWNKEL